MDNRRKNIFEKIQINENKWRDVRRKYDLSYGGDGSGKYFTQGHISALKIEKLLILKHVIKYNRNRSILI